MRVSLEQKLLQYINKNEGWHKKGHLYSVSDQLGYSPEGAGRCLRKLAEEGKIFVQYYDGRYSKNLAMYCAEKPPEPVKVTYKEVIINGSRIMQRVEV